MSHHPAKGNPLRRVEHANKLRDKGHRKHLISSNTEPDIRTSSRSHTKPSDKGPVELAAVNNPDSTSFDILQVETSSVNSASLMESWTVSNTIPWTSSQSTQQTATATADLPDSTSANVDSPSTSRQGAQTSFTKEKPLQLQVDVSSIERTTLIVPPTFSIPDPSASNLGTTSLSLSFTSVDTAGISLTRSRTTYPTTWTLSISTATRTHSVSASTGPVVHPPASHPHISPVLTAFMVLGGIASLGLSLYVFKRVRYKALHVSRSQFQINPNSSSRSGQGAVQGSESDTSFVSGGLDQGQVTKKEKNGYLDAGGESPLWGGREKFSPRIGDGVVDFPPVAYLGEGSRNPTSHRRSLMQTVRRYAPGGRVSRSGPGWNTIQEERDVYAVPTVKITDMDTRHNRLGSGSTFSSAPGGSPDPNLATIQVASVTRTLSVAASYQVGSPPPSVLAGLDHPRPAPKVPSKALILDQAPLLPRQPGIPAVTITSSDWAPNISARKPLETSMRGKISVTDISKPRPVKPVNTESPDEADPMVFYAKYSAGLDLREGSPKYEPLRHESSMAQRIAQIAHSKSTATVVESQTSLSNRDTRALAAAAGVGSPVPGEDHTFHGFNNQQATWGNPLPKRPAPTSLPPASPGLGEVGNVMLRPFGESGAMVPAFLETPAIGLDGRLSYLSSNLGPELGPAAGPLRTINAKVTPAALESDLSAATLSPSMLSDDPSRRTIASTYSQDFMPLSQQAHLRQNPDYKSPTYSIYNLYGPDRVSTVPRMPSMVYGDREPQIGGAL